MRAISKRKGGVVNDTVQGVGGLIIGVVVVLVVIATLIGANLLTANSEYDNVSDRMAGNFTEGLDNISAKIPTILLIVAVVFLFGALVLLVMQSKRMGVGGSGGSL